MLVCFFISHARLRVHWASGFPCALFLSRDNVRANLGRIASRERGFTFAVIASEAKQSMGLRSKLDCFVASLLATTA
jgi:hypothetical protein